MAEPLMTPEQRLVALEQLEARQGRIQKRAVWGAGFLAFAAVVLAILIGFATYQLADVQKKIHNLNSDLKKKKRTLADVNAELTQKQDLLASISHKLGTGQVPAAREELQKAESGLSKIIPRVFIHIRSKEQLDISKKITEMLRTKGYNVPRADILVDQGPGQTEVRYFHSDEDKEAADIALGLSKELNLTDAKSKPIRGFETSPLVKPRQFEIWLGPGAR